MEFCVNCMKPRYIENAYGEILCDECWEEYLTTERGLVEYFIYITEGRSKVKHYDADFLGEVGVSWKRHRSEIKLPELEIKMLEEAAFFLGII